MKEKAITLISLVITIIILLILAGISIVALGGENGLFARAKQAKQKTNEAAAIEEMSIIVSQVQADKLGDATLSDVVEVLESNTENTYIVRTTKTVATLDASGITDITQITSETPAIYVTNTKYNVEVEVNSSLKIASTGTEGSTNSGTNAGTGDENGSEEETEVDTTPRTGKIKVSCTAENVINNGVFAIKIMVTDTESYEKFEYNVNGSTIYTSTNGSEKTYYYNGTVGQNYKITVYGYKNLQDTGNEIEISSSYPTLYSYANVGDWVNYDAGNWTSSETSGFTTSLPTSQGQFSKLDATSKNQSITPYSTSANTYSGGWRVLSKDASTETVTLVHAGTTAAYYHEYGYSSTSITNLNNFCSTYYGASSTRPMVSSARSVAYTDYSTGNLTTTTGLLTTGSVYWFSTAYGSYYLYFVTSGSVSYNDSRSFGVRPVVSLKSGVKTTGKTTNAYNTSVQGWDLTYSE